MKKFILPSILLLVMCSVLIHRYFSTDIIYETGKDTHDCFGNGEYQLLNSSGAINDKQYSLFNMNYHISIIDNVIEYQEFKKTIYFYGEHQGNTVYAFLYLDDNRIIYCQPQGDVDILYANDMIKKQKLEIVSNLSDFERKINIEIN